MDQTERAEYVGEYSFLPVTLKNEGYVMSAVNPSMSSSSFDRYRSDRRTSSSRKIDRSEMEEKHTV